MLEIYQVLHYRRPCVNIQCGLSNAQGSDNVFSLLSAERMGDVTPIKGRLNNPLAAMGFPSWR